MTTSDRLIKPVFFALWELQPKIHRFRSIREYFILLMVKPKPIHFPYSRSEKVIRLITIKFVFSKTKRNYSFCTPLAWLVRDENFGVIYENEAYYRSNGRTNLNNSTNMNQRSSFLISKYGYDWDFDIASYTIVQCPWSNLKVKWVYK